MKIVQIHQSAQKVLESYQKLPLGEKAVRCPYHINSGNIKDLRVMVGKGSPEEIVTEVKVWAQLKGFDLAKMDEKQIREFMKERRIGIDCSGMLYHMYDRWLKASRHKGLYHHIKFPYKSPLGRLKLRLRPAENIGANLLTSELNTDKIPLADIRPGDLIRSKSRSKHVAHHVIVITKVAIEHNVIRWFEYFNSTYEYGADNGVRDGKVEITDIGQELRDQKWLDASEDGTHPLLEGLNINYQDNGLRRLKFFHKLKQNDGNISS